MTLSRTDISRENLAKNLAEIGLSKNYRLVGGQRVRNRMAKILDIAGHTQDPYKTVIGIVKPSTLIAISIYLGSCPGPHRRDIRPRIRVQQTPSFVTCRRICRPNKRINGTRVNPIGRTALTLFVFFPFRLLRFISIRITISLLYLYCCLISGSVPFHWSGTSTSITNNYFRLNCNLVLTYRSNFDSTRVNL